MPRRCALGCTPTKGVLHVFPNPSKFPEQFKAWVKVFSGKTECDFDYKSKRVCDRHFTLKDRNRNNRLNALAVPSLYLPEHNVCISATTTPELTPLKFKIPHIHQQMHDKAAEVQSICTSTSTTSKMPSDLSQMTSADLLKTEKVAEVQIICESTSTTSDLHQMTKASPFKAGLKQRKPSTVTSNKIRVYQKNIKNLRRQIYRLRKRGRDFKARLVNAEKVSNMSDFQKVAKNMTTAAKLFCGMQYHQTKKKPSGRRFKMEEKVLSLSLYKRSPKCYGLMSKFFVLPSTKSLKRLLAQINLNPGINQQIFEKLKKTVSNLNTEDRLCTVIFDEMSITPQIHYDSAKDELKGFSTQTNAIANHALVFMVKGIKKNFKQPVAYYFTNSLNKIELKKCIGEVITNVQESGLIVLCTICDQSAVNVSAINELVEETKAKYLRRQKEVKHDFYEISKKKIIPLYDVPHLIKGLRNNLLTKTLVYVDYEDENKEKEVKWEYLEKLYAADKSFGELRCLQKLTEEHINPEKIKKMRVKSAAQIFSHSVAVATEHLTARGKLPDKCRDLIPITLLIDNVFDSLNCSSFVIPNGKIFKGPVKNNSPHHQMWQKAIKCFKSMKFVYSKKSGNKVRKVESVVPCIKNFVKTIEGIQQLWKILSQKYCFDSMLTRNFNQDPIENFFGNIRSCGARNTAPNAIAFEGAFKTLLLNNFNAPHSAQANCENDVNDFLQSLEFFVSEKTIEPPTDVPEEIPLRNEFLYDYSKGEDDVGQRTYVCGFVLRKCLKNIVKKCKTCRKNLTCTENLDSNAYIRAKEYFKNKKSLVYPSQKLDECFQEVQNICVSHLKKDVPKVALKRTINIFVDIFVNFPFTCETHKDSLRKYFQEVTLNVLIYSWCRSINRILAGKLTYDGEDEMKCAAQIYYNKYKHNKTNK